VLMGGDPKGTDKSLQARSSLVWHKFDVATFA
jgi:hypothetical protein